MAKELPSIDTNSDTFLSWIIKTNSIITLCNTEIVTANNSTNGAITTGNGYVYGAFGANTLVATYIRGGNTIANSVLTISSNTYFTANTYRFDSGITLGANSLVNEHGIRYVASNTSNSQVADSFTASSYRTVKYVISITDTTNGVYQATEILVLNDGATTYTTEYATLVSGSQICTFKTDISSGKVRLLVTPTVAPLQLNIARTLISS